MNQIETQLAEIEARARFAENASEDFHDVDMALKDIPALVKALRRALDGIHASPASPADFRSSRIRRKRAESDIAAILTKLGSSQTPEAPAR